MVHAPFSGRVPIFRPIGWASTQDPANGFGGQRIYLQRGLFRHTGYFAHLGALNLKRGQRFKQGDPIGPVWNWPGDPGRSHCHVGYEGGDPLDTLVRADGSFVIDENFEPKPKLFPIPKLTKVGGKHVVRVGDKIVYSGGKAQAFRVLSRRKRARRIDLFFRDTKWAGGVSPLVGAGMDMVKAADRFGLKDGERLMASIAACETSGGTLGDGRKVNNFYGILSHGDHRAFRTRKDGIDYLAELLAKNYVRLGFDTIEKIGGKYAPVGASNDPHGKNEKWIGCVSKRYDELGGVLYLPEELLPE